MGYAAAGPREYPPARGDVSGITGTGALGGIEVTGAVPFVQTPVAWNALGSAIHAFLAVDDPAMAADERLALATGALQRWSVQGTLRADALIGAADGLRAWTDTRWPGAARHHEWPVRLRQADGTELVGYADMVVMGDDSFVLVDHKCPEGTREDAMAKAAAYAGQIWTYAHAIAQATGKRAAGCFVHLVTQGCVVAIGEPMR